MGPAVKLRARLEGEGRTADCTLVVWTESSSSGRVYTLGKILEEAGLPDGRYTLTFDGQTVQTAKWMGRWRLTFLPPEIHLPDVA
jgi:hypothetical protein